MNKKILGIFLIANISMAIKVETEIKFGFDATWGGEGISTPVSKLGAMLEVALPRQNIFGETYPELPSFSSSVSTRSVSNLSENKKEKPAPIIVKNQDEADIEYSKRYVSRQVQFDKTLLDAKVKIDDIGSKFGIVLKARPHRLDQGFNIFDINRAYAYANVDTERIKLDSAIYFTGYENGTPGLNKYYEGQKISPKSKFEFNIASRITPIKYYITPDISFKYMGNFITTNDYSINPALQIRALDNDKHFLGISLGYEVGKNKENDALKYILKDAKTFSYGNRNVEYFKNWELGDKILDNTFNKDGKLLDKDGNQAYRIIGKRDINKGHLSGLFGSVRMVGTPTGALYGKTLIKRVMEEVVSVSKENIRDHDTLFNAIKAQKIVGSGLILGQVFKPTLKQDVEDLINNKDNKRDILLEKVIRNVMSEINVEIDEPVSDFHSTHLIPREYREFLPKVLPDIPYEDTAANKKKRENEAPYPDIIIDPNYTGKASNYSERSVVEARGVDVNKIDWSKYGTNAVGLPSMIYAPHDSRNAIFKAEFKDSIEKFANIAKRSKEKFSFNALINYIKDGNFILKDLLHSGKLKNLFFAPENLETFDMFANLQFNKTEAEHRGEEYTSELYDILSDNIEAYEGSTKFKVDKSKDKIFHGYTFKFEYLNKEKPIYLSLSSNANKVNSETKINKIDNTVLAKNLHYYKEYMYNKNYASYPERNFSHWISEKTDIVEKESIYNFNNSIELNYKGEQLDFTSRLDTSYKKIHFESLRNERLDYAMFGHVGPAGVIKKDLQNKYIDFISKVNIDYSKFILNPKASISYNFIPSKYIYIKPTLAFEGYYSKNIYEKFEYARYSKQEENTENSKLKEINVNIFERDKDNKLIKAENAPRSRDDYFNSLNAGDSVDLSKISKYAIDDVDASFKKKKEVGGVSHWEKPISEVMLALDLSINPIKYLSIGYHFNAPLIFKGKDLDGFYIKNGLSLSVKF